MICNNTTGISENATGFTLTVITAQKPDRLSKRFTLADGKLVKENGGNLIRGISETIAVQNIKEFGELLKTLNPNQAVTYGVTGFPKAIIKSGNVKTTRGKTDYPILTRTRANFNWPVGAGILMLDYDPAPGETPATREKLIDTITSIIPTLKQSPFLWRPSVSSCIKNSLTGETLKGISGQRIYIPVKNAADILRAGESLFKRLWLAGFGRIEISKAGSFLTRTIIDASVFQPERLDFAGGASLGDGLIQELPDPEVFNPQGHYLDTEKELPDLSDAEQVTLADLIATAKSTLSGQQELVRDKWIEAHVKQEISYPENHPKEEVEKVVNKYRAITQTQNLPESFTIRIKDNYGERDITIEELLKNKRKYNGVLCQDPLEPEYHGGQFLAYVNLLESTPNIYSHAHGGIRYKIETENYTDYVMLGEEIEKANAVRLIADLESAEKIHAAIGGTIIYVGKINRLAKIADDVRFKYKTVDLILCASNNPTELETAHRVALEVSGKVTMPSTAAKFSELSEVEIADQIFANETLPHPEIAFRKSIREYQERPGIRQRFLNDLNLQPGINFIKSPQGTGKTVGLIPYAKMETSFLAITHRQSLATKAANDFGLDLYLNMEKDDMNYASQLSICINSLYKLSGEGKPTPRYEIVLLDESEQILRALVESNMQYKDLIMATLKFILKNAKFIVLADADLSPLTMEFIKNILPNSPVNMIENLYQIGQGRTVILENNPAKILGDAEEMLEMGKRVYINSNHKLESRKIFLRLKERFPSKKGLYISGDNGGDVEVINFFKDANAEEKNYDFIITTPSANTGLSINATPEGNAKFDYIATIVYSDIGTHTDAIQSLHRVREAKEIHAYIQRRHNPEPRSRDKIESKWIRAESEAEKVGVKLTLDEYGKRRVINDLYSDLCVDVIQQRETSQQNLFYHMLLNLALQGFSFAYATTPEEKAEVNNRVAKIAKEMEAKDYEERILTAPKINNSEANKLKDTRRKSLSETNKITRYELEEFYPQIPLGEAIKIDDRGRYRKAMLRLSSMFYDDERLIKKHENQKLKLTADKFPFIANRLFIKILIMTAANLYADKNFYTREHPEILQFVDLMIKHRLYFQSVASIPTDNVLRKNPLKFFGEQLRRIGLTQHAKGATRGGGYHLDIEPLQLAGNILEGLQQGVGEKFLNIFNMKVGALPEAEPQNPVNPTVIVKIQPTPPKESEKKVGIAIKIDPPDVAEMKAKIYASTLASIRRDFPNLLIQPSSNY